MTPGANLLSIMDNLTEKLNHPLSLRYTPYTVKAILISTILYGLGVGIYYANQRNYRRGEEHGSAKWGDVKALCKKYRAKPYSNNLLLTDHFRMGLDVYRISGA